MPSLGARIRLIGELLNLRLNVTYSTDIKNTVAVIAVPFNCYLLGHTPDETNLGIAKAATLYISHGRMFIGQWEHTSILENWGFPVAMYPGSTGRGKWVRTDRLLKWVAKRLREQGTGMRVVMLGHPEHLPRASALARYYGIEPVLVPESRHVPYDPRTRPGYQDWCVNEEKWRAFEFLKARPALILSVLTGLI